MERTFWLITGIMAAGKSTVAQLLSERLEKSVHVRGDVFRRMIVSGRSEMSENPAPEALFQLNLRYELASHTAKAYYDAGFSVVLQDNYYADALPQMLDRLSGYPVRVVVLCPDAATVARREAERGKTGYTGFSVEKLHVSFMRETPRLGLWLDTSDMTPEETVDRIMEHYGQGDRENDG